MSEDFDIYADLEHIEKEAKQESHELLALQQKIHDLHQKVRAAEQEKTDIVRQNKILLENVSSLLLTAKAEIQRKDATINDLRKQCDNAVFRRQNHVAKSANYATKFTQTPATHSANVGVQTLSVECNDRLRSKSRIAGGRDSSRNRDGEHDAWMHNSKAVSERDRSHGRDRTTHREKERHQDHRHSERDLDRYYDRDQERNRNRDRDRYHDSDRERDRDRHSERHRKSLHERHNSPKEHRSNERSRGKIDLKPHKGRTRNKERSPCEKHVPDRYRPIEDDDRYKSNSSQSEYKQGYLGKGPRTPDSTQNATVTSIDLNHTANMVKLNNIESKMQKIASNTLELPCTSNETFHRSSPILSKSTEIVDTYSQSRGIQVIDDYRMQGILHDRRTETIVNSDSSESCLQRDNDKEVERTGKTSSKYQQNKVHATESSTLTSKNNIKSTVSEVAQEHIEQLQDHQTTVAVDSYQSQNTYSESPLNSLAHPRACSNYDESFAEGNANSRFKIDDKNVHLSKSSGPSSSNVSDDLVINCASLDKATASNASVSDEVACTTLHHTTHNEDGKRSSKNIRSNVAAEQAQTNIISELEKKKDKLKKSSKRKSKTEPGDDVQNEGSTVVQENKRCQRNLTDDEPNPSPLKRKRKDENLEPLQYDTIVTNTTNEAQEVKHADSTAPVSVTDTLAGSKNDGPSTTNVKDVLILKSASLAEACSSIVVDGSTVDTCGILADMTHNEDGKESSKENHLNASTNHDQISFIGELEKKKDKQKKSSKRKSKTEPGTDVQNDGSTVVQKNKGGQLRPTNDVPNSSPLKRERKDDNLEPPQFQTIQTNTTNESREFQSNQPQELTSVSVTKHANPTAPVSVTDTFAGTNNDDPSSSNVSDVLILKSATLAEASSSIVADGSTRNEDQKETSKGVRRNDAANHPKCSLANELDKKKDKRNKSSKRKSKTEPGEDVQYDASMGLQENKFCQLTSTNDEPNPSPLKRERQDDSLEPAHCDIIQTNTTNEDHEIQPNQPHELTSVTASKHADSTAPVSVTDALPGTNTDGTSSNNVCDVLILKSATLAEASSSIVADGSTVDKCSIIADATHNEDLKGTRKDIHSNVEPNHAQTITTSGIDKKKDKRNKSSKRKSRTEPAEDGELNSTNDEPNPSPLTNERKDDNLEATHCDIIETNTANVALESHSNHIHELITSAVIKHADPSAPSTDSPAGSKNDGPSSMNVSDDFVLTSASLDESTASLKDSCKDIPLIVAENQAQTNVTSELDNKKDKHKKSSKRKSRTKSTSSSTSVQNDASSNKVPNNELCQNELTNVGLNRSPRNREGRKLDNSGPSQHKLIETKNIADESYNIPAYNTQETTCPSVAIENEDHNEIVNDNKDVNNQQQPSSIAEAISLSESNSHCLTLRDRRSNSYSAVLESSENQPPERMAMSIQTYFMTFNEQQDDNVKSVRVEEESLSTNITESVPWTVATEVEIETNSTPNDDDTIKVSNKPKVSTAEAVRERLRKRINANVQKAPPGSEISATATISPKRRLSIDSVASIVGKRLKLETAVLVDETKRSGVPPSPKLSSTYFSQIALPITSALDSIPSKLKSPNVKHGAWDSMLKTPMVVVHSPAKPSQQTSENVPIYYPSCPADSSSLQNIMHSLFDTPIKNEVPDRVSPPCEDDNQQISTANYDNVEICSTPLSTKPIAPFNPFKNEDRTTNHLSRKSTRERQEPSVPPARPNEQLQDGVLKVHEKPFEPVVQSAHSTKKSTTRSSQHAKPSSKIETHLGSKKSLRNLGKSLHTLPATRDSSQLNENNNCSPPSSKPTAKKVNDVPDGVCDKNSANDTVTKQQPINASSMSKMLKKAQQPANNDASSTLLHEKQVKPSIQDTRKPRNNAPSCSKRATENPLPNVSAQSSARDSTTIVPSNKRSRKQTNDDEKRLNQSTKSQPVEPHLNPIKDAEPLPCCSKSSNEPQKPDPQRVIETSTVVPVHSERSMERLSPQTNAEQLSVPQVRATIPTTNAQVPGRAAVTTTCVVSNVTLNLSLADSTSNNHHNSARKSAAPVQHVREMRIVKESPSLMRIFIKRK